MDETEECQELRRLLKQPLSELWFKEAVLELADQLGQVVGEPTLRELLEKKLRTKIQETGQLDYEEVGKTDYWSKCTVTFNGKPQDRVIWADAAKDQILIWDKGEEKLLEGKVRISPARQQSFF